MDDRNTNWEEAWQDMEPEQPRSRRGGYVVALLAAAFLFAGTCALAFFILQQRTTPEPGILLPSEATEAAEAQGTSVPGVVATEANDGQTLAPTVTLPGSFATPPQPPPASDVFAPRAAAPPTIDGNAAEWADIPAYSSPYVVFTSGSWDGSDDLAASWQVMWDDANLYLLVNVTDDFHVQNQTGNQTFRGDSVELQIDTDRAGDYGPSLSPDDFQISLSPGDFATLPPSAFRFQGTPDGKMLDAAAPHSIILTAVPTGSGYVLEAAIPWRDLNLTPAAGLVLGFVLNVNDNDRPGVAVQEMMKSSVPNRRFGDPTTWGTLTLQ